MKANFVMATRAEADVGCWVGCNSTTYASVKREANSAHRDNWRDGIQHSRPIYIGLSNGSGIVPVLVQRHGNGEWAKC